MANQSFKAYVVREEADNFIGRIEDKAIDALPEGEVLIRVSHSSLNYKDALSASGNRGVTREFPHTPGIDAVGRVVEMRSVKPTKFGVGQEVLVTGFDLGMNTAGGFGQFIRVPASWVLPLPAQMSAKEAAILGTAGLTAALSVYKLSMFVSPKMGPIAVSGASGGVGSLALSILKNLGYETIAISGKGTCGEEEFLKSLGVSAIIDRAEFSVPNKKPMLKAYLGGAIDTVGGPILDNLIKLTKPEGAVTCCGNAASGDLDLTVYPFILRGLSLMGIDSQSCPIATRELLWKKLATSWKPLGLMGMYREISLSEVGDALADMRKGLSRGRTIVNLNS